MTLHSRTTTHQEAKSKKAGAVNLKGKLQRFNFSPKGGIEGLILEDGDGIIQVIVQPELAGSLPSTLAIGKTLQLTAEIEADIEGDHPVYKLLQLHGKDAASHASSRKSLQGKVVAINYAKHGEANGVVLDSGDFLHLKPDGMDKAGLTIGDEVKASGSARSHVLGGLAIEVEEINGQKLAKKKPPH